ncbi:MAG: S8 family serine peptidase [Planctomycetota bacterium]|jgi:hypothetical protein
MKSQNRKSMVNFTGFCAALLATWIVLSGFAQAEPDSFQVVSVKKADGTNDIRLFDENSTLAFAVKDGQVSDLVSVKSPDCQKVIVKFKEKPLIKYKGKHKTLRDQAASKIEFEHKNFSKDILGLENASRKAKGKPAADIRKILKKKYKHVFNGAAVELSSETLTAVQQLCYVEAVYPDAEVKISLNESVPLIGASQIWSDFGITGKDIVVSIVDTGIDYTHPDLGGSAGFPSAKVIGGYDCYNNDNDPMDDHYHGTHVAGIVAANGQLKGVAYEASLMAYKVLSASGSGSFSTVIQGIELSTDPDRDPSTDDGADVINMSLGGSGNPDDPVSQAVDNAVNSGVVVVVAAGNSGSYSTILSPGVARKALTVGASDKADQLAYFSSKGPIPGTFSIKPDVTAPGYTITASQLGGGNRVLSGTSMAAPHVAGAAALLLQSNPDLLPEDVKHIFMGTAVDIGYDVFCQGSGRIDIYKAVKSNTVISPASLSLGLDDVSQSIWEKTEFIVIENLSSDSALYTYSVSLSSPLPEGINISVPDTVTLDPLTGTADLEFNISVDNTVLPSAAEAPYSYEGVLLISNGSDTHRVPFAFIKSPVLTLNFDKVPNKVSVYNKIDKHFKVYPNSTSTTLVIPQGNYDLMVFFDYFSTVVLRENIDVIDNTTLTVSSTEAVHDLFFDLVDYAGNPLVNNTAILWYCTHNSGLSNGVYTTLGTVLRYAGNLKFSDMSENYTFEWSASDMTRNHTVTHELGAKITEGIYSDIDFSNTADEYRAIEYTYEVDQAVDDMFILHFLHHAWSRSMIGLASYNRYDPPLTRDIDGQFRRMFYIKPFESADYSTSSYSSEWICDYTGDGEFDYRMEVMLYQTALFSAVVNQPVKGLYFPEFDNPVFSTTDVDHITVGMGPHYWFGRMTNYSSSLRVYSSITRGSKFYISQWGDFAAYAESHWQLFDENGQYIQGGDSSGTNGAALYKAIYLPSAGKYKLVVPYDGYYRINGLPGNITTTLTFDTTKTDRNPPYLQHFRVLSDGRVTDSLSEGLANEIKFELFDDETAIENASLFISPYSQAADWQQVPLIVNGNSYGAVIPDLPQDDFVSMKLVAVDTAGNSFTTEWHPAFYYQTNPGAPVADAGEDQNVYAEYGSETAAVTLDGSASYDPDRDIVSYIWKEGQLVLGNEAVIEATLSIGTHDISLTVTDNDGLSSTDITQVVVTREEPSGPVIYVQDINLTAAKRGKKWAVTALVTIFDDSNNPVRAANLSANWSGSVTQDVFAVTSAKGGKKRIGKAKFTLSGITEAGTFTFTVNNVAKSGMTYHDALNVETSDTIVIQ